MLRTGLPLELSYYRGTHHSAVAGHVNLTVLFHYRKKCSRGSRCSRSSSFVLRSNHLATLDFLYKIHNSC